MLCVAAQCFSTVVRSERVCHRLDVTQLRAYHSSCPSQKWWDSLAPYLPDAVIFINVGANKGYAIAAMEAGFGANVSVGIRHKVAGSPGMAWFVAIQEYAAVMGHLHDPKHQEKRRRSAGAALCGTCRACVEAPISAGRAKSLRSFAIELLPSNVQWLRAAVDRFHLTTRIFNYAAGKSSNATVRVQDLPLGSENGQAGEEGTYTVETRALDDFFVEQNIQHPTFVSIDTEGHDGLVISGMRRHLEQAQVDAFEFEYGRSAWSANSPEPLNTTLKMLDDWGYSCFWQGEDGCISTASCWPEVQMTVSWGNVLCVQAQGRAAAMHASIVKFADGCSQARSPGKVSRRWSLIGKHDKQLLAVAQQVYLNDVKHRRNGSNPVKG